MSTTIDTKPRNKTDIIAIRRAKIPGHWQVVSKDAAGVISIIITLDTKKGAQAFVMGMKFAEDGHYHIAMGGHIFSDEV